MRKMIFKIYTGRALIFLVLVLFLLTFVYAVKIDNETVGNLTENMTLENETSKVEKVEKVEVNREPFSSINFIQKADPKIEDGIYEELKEKNEVRVIIMLEEKEISEKKLSEEEFGRRKKNIREKQDKVLNKISKNNFEIKHRYKTINAIAGIITIEGVEELEDEFDVEKIYLDRKAYASLSESVPLINADDVLALGYTGLGQTVCVIDTGVDYLHSDLGNSACGITIDGTNESYSLESAHPYSNNFDYTWTITQSGFTNIAVHFSSIELEKGYDFLYVLDANGNILQEFGRDTASYSDVWSVSIPGETIKIRLVTDYSITEWGFAIDQVLNGVVSTWTNCGQVVGGYDFVNEDNDPIDDEGHGTHVAGIIASQNSVYKGVAPGANIVAAKVLNSVGSGWFTDVAAAIDWCMDNKDIYNIIAMSLSLGDGGEYNDPATQCDPYLTASAINNAFNQGIFVSVASGNEGYLNGISYPACASGAISVGATYDANVGRKNWAPTCIDRTTETDKIVCFTNRDEILDLLAPGCETTSLKLNGGTVTYCGTSMATPHVAGVAALMLQANPTLTPVQMRDTLKSTGVSIYDGGTGLTFPRVDALAAVQEVSEFISITLIGYPLDFGNLDMSVTDEAALGNPYTVRVEPETTVNVDIYHKGDDFTNGGSTITIDNVKYDYDSSVSGAMLLNNNYLSKIYTNVGTGDYNLYYWISIPSGQRAGGYSNTIYIKAVETGTPP